MLRDLFTEAGNMRRHTAGAKELRRHLRVSTDTKLLAVLNAEDVSLENLWSNEHRRLSLRRLVDAGVVATTGPTYSVLQEDGQRPASHNLVMLQRHHQVAFEAHRVGLIVIPNIYWRSREDLIRWSRWLDREIHVSCISRDFSLTKQLTPFLDELRGLVSILRGVDRPIHVLLIGVGEAKAEIVRELFSDVGSPWSVVSGRPLLAAKNGILIPDRDSAESREQKTDLPYRTLARENIRRFECAMHGPASGTYQDGLQTELFADAESSDSLTQSP